MDMTAESGEEMLSALFKKADFYDNTLMEQFGCTPRLEEN
jgi:hypothetical protein